MDGSFCVHESTSSQTSNSLSNKSKSFFDLLTHRNNAPEAPLPDCTTRQRGISGHPHNKDFPDKTCKFQEKDLFLHPDKIRKIMNAVSLNNLWDYIKGLSLTASNQRWLAERLMEASTKDLSDGEHSKLAKLNALFGAWDDADGSRIEETIHEARACDYERELVSMDDKDY